MATPAQALTCTFQLPTWQEVRKESAASGEETAAASAKAERGAYAAFATWYGQRVVRLEHHLSRLLDSAARLGVQNEINLRKLRSTLQELLTDTGFPEAKIWVTVRTNGTLTIRMEPFAGPPEAQKRDGVSCGLLHGVVRDTPEAKASDWIAERDRLIRDTGRQFYEWLLVSKEGKVLEGTRSNFYVLLAANAKDTVSQTRDGDSSTLQLLTADREILPGTARAIVLEVAPRFVAVTKRAPAVFELGSAEEAFLTSASRGIVPIVSIEETTIGTGRPGAVTQTLMQAYDARAKELATPLSL